CPRRRRSCGSFAESSDGGGRQQNEAHATYRRNRRMNLMMRKVELKNGVEMPMLGFGVFQVEDAARCRKVVGEAVETGYRLFDTAMTYRNEEAVGQALAASGVKREESFVRTKVWITYMGYDRTLRAFDRSMRRLRLDYLDLYLLHMPFGDYYGAWRALERLYRE